jgi:hypothetical protein
MRNYFLKTRKKDGKAPLYTRIRRRNPNLDIWVNCLIDVDVEKWEKASTSLEAWRKYERTPEGLKVVPLLQNIDAALNTLMEDPSCTKEIIDERIAEVVYQDEYARKRELEEQERQRIQAEKEAERKDVLLYLDNYIKDIKAGERLDIHNHTYRPNTCKVWTSFQRILIRFYETTPFTWEDIDKRLSDKFTHFLESEGYMIKSINKYLICFKAMVYAAQEDKFHTNAITRKIFAKKDVAEEDKEAEVYLTAEEIQKLYEMKLSGMKDKVRDVFLVGCYTCQRFSDYGRLTDKNFVKSAEGNDLVSLTQVKTSHKVKVPVLNNNLKKIARKYNGNLPRVSDVILNRYIKEILKELSESVPSLMQVYPTTLTMKERAKEAKGECAFMREDGKVIKPKYELVSSHTARRSGITILYLTKRFDIRQMMSVSGHKDTKTFISYIKVSDEELADQIAEDIKKEGEVF